MNYNFLAIGWRVERPGIREEDFFEGPAFSSVDALFLDPRSISERWVYAIPPEKDGVRRTYTERDRGFGRILIRLMAKRRSEAADLLYKRGGVIVCHLYPRGEPIEVMKQGVPSERIDRYSWLPTTTLVDRQHQLTFPANARFLPRRGEDVVFAESGDPFEDYLHEFEGKISYRAVYQDLLESPIDRFARVLARNRVGDIIALSIPFDEGRLVLLPPIEGVSPAREGAALVRAVSQYALRPAFFSPPDWLPAYPLPGEEALRDELSSLVDRRDKLIRKVDEVSSQMEEVTRYKRVLYTKGRFTLIPAVADSFRALGFEIEESDYDLLLRCNEGDAIGAVAATERATVDLPPYRRLLDWVDRARTSGEGPHKGILIVSGSRELDPKRRPTQFSPEVLRGCTSQGFCLLTTYELYKLVVRALQERDKTNLARLRRALLECDGEFRGVD
jgi:hypothetical protein